MKQINEKQLLFEKGEITGEKCIDSMCNMVDTYQHASPKEQYDIEQRLYHHCPELAGCMIKLCRQGVRKDFPNFKNSVVTWHSFSTLPTGQSNNHMGAILNGVAHFLLLRSGKTDGALNRGAINRFCPRTKPPAPRLTPRNIHFFVLFVTLVN